MNIYKFYRINKWIIKLTVKFYLLNKNKKKYFVNKHRRNSKKRECRPIKTYIHHLFTNQRHTRHFACFGFWEVCVVEWHCLLIFSKFLASMMAVCGISHLLSQWLGNFNGKSLKKEGRKMAWLSGPVERKSKSIIRQSPYRLIFDRHFFQK